jgi:CheY-like chemotaxis protein
VSRSVGGDGGNWVSETLRALCRETKALIIVSEFEAKRMPMFQLRAVLEAIVRDDEERKVVIDLVDADLRATGYPADQVSTFLNDLISLAAPKPMNPGDQNLLGTRRLRSPFARGFEDAETAAPVTTPNVRDTKVIQRPMPAPAGVVFMNPKFDAASAPPPDAPAPAPAPPTSVVIPTTPAPIPAPSRRSTMMFEQNASAPHSPEGQRPAGERTLPKHEAIFGGRENKPLAPSRPMVLLADDDKRARMVYRLRVEGAGYATIECEDGREAWERIQQGGIDAVVLDMKMPGMHGLEVLSAMAAMPETIPVVVCSAYDQLGDEFVVKTYPKLRYITKPVAPDKLVATLRELIQPKPAS